MKPTRPGKRVLGLVSLASVALLSLPLSGCVFACPLIGYGDDSPIEIVIEGTSGPVEVQACLNADCTPEQVIADADGRWLVPQEPPYFAGVSPTTVTVEVLSGGQTTTGTFDIPREAIDSDWLNQCPGPFRYLPVVVTVD